MTVESGTGRASVPRRIKLPPCIAKPSQLEADTARRNIGFGAAIVWAALGSNKLLTVPTAELVEAEA